jgi:hypothetical protein
MTSFAVSIKPGPQTRLAAVVLLIHIVAAAMPWIARVESAFAALLSVLAIGGLALTLARVPGRHCALAAVAVDGRGCRVRLAGRRVWQAAEVDTGARAYGSVVHLVLRVDGQRLGWLLTRRAVPDADFRRLRARIRLSC